MVRAGLSIDSAMGDAQGFGPKLCEEYFAQPSPNPERRSVTRS